MWRLVDVSYDHDAPANLALEEAIARKVGEGTAPNTIRFWKNDNAAVIGRFQSAALELNLEACKRHQVAIVRRFTGGGAVYHDSGNLNYSISLRKEPWQNSSDIYDIFRAVSLGIIEGLSFLGIHSKLKTVNTIEVGDRKISGLAGSAKWGAFLVHGSILVNSDLKLLSAVLSPPVTSSCSRYVRSHRMEVDNVANILGREVAVSEVRHALIEGFEKVFGTKLTRGNLLKEEIDLVEQLYGQEILC